MSATLAAKFLFVMAVTPHGHFRVAGQAFTREWRVVEVADEADHTAAIPKVTQETADEINRLAQPQRLFPREPVSPPALAVRPASADEVDELRARLAAERGLDKDEVIAQLTAKNNDLEARLLRLELAMSAPKKSAAEKSGAEKG